MLYEVRFTAKSEGVAVIAWAPEGSDFQCGKREAMRRRDHLLEQGREGVPVDGAVPWCVEVVNDGSKVMFSVTTEPDDVPAGPWAKEAA